MNSKQGVPGAEQLLRSLLGQRADMVFVLALVVLVAGLIGFGHVASLGPTASDPDSMMRLVEVRDFLAGQGWFDLVQYRLDPPDGVLMHWSRLVDAPIAALITVATPIVGRASAEIFAINVWPVLLVIPFAFALASVAERFGGTLARLVTLLMIFLSPQVKGVFSPGDIDHHNVQAVLVALVLAGLVRADYSRRYPVLAGLMAALSLAIGMETLVSVALAVLGLAIAWTIDADRWRRGLVLFNGALMAGTLVVTLITVPPSRWLMPACDVLSIAYIVPVLVGGFAVIAVAVFLRGHGDGSPGLMMRGGALVAIGSLLVAISAVVFPTCLLGPYGGVDPAIRPIWLDHVAEAQGLVATLSGRPTLALPLYVPPFVALALGLVALPRLPLRSRTAFAIVLSILGGSALLGVMQLRALVGAQIVASVAVGVAVAQMVKLTADRNDLRAILSRWCWLPAVPALWFLAVQPFEASSGRSGADDAEAADMTTCRAFFTDALAARTPGVVLATSNFGAHLLAATPHAVLAAPYHRDSRGILAVDAVFAGDDPHAAFTESGATYLAACLGDPELQQMAARAPKGLAADLIARRWPYWLNAVAVSPAGVVFAPVPPAPDVTGSLPVLPLRPSITD